MKLTVQDDNKIIDYLKLYGKMYDKEILEYIINNYQDAIGKKDRLCELSQIYARLDILPRNINTYIYYLRKLVNNHDINSNILEVGGGCYPIFAHYLATKQKRGKKGKITVYDPKLITSRLNHIVLKKERFTSETDVSNYDLLIGIMPDEATVDLVKHATNYHKELFLVLGEYKLFLHYYPEYGIPNLKEWEEYIRELIYKDSDSFTIKESRVPNEYGKQYLIFDKKKNIR